MTDWRAIYPELEWITDRSLADKVAAVWDEAYRRGGWSGDDIKGIPFTLLVGETSVTLAEHTRLVTGICRSVAETMKKAGSVPLDNDILIAGALLHDVGKLLEYKRAAGGFQVSRSGKLLRHPLSGMGLAMKGDLPEDVYHIVAVHSREGEGSYRSPEAIVLHHADFIAFETIKAMGASPPKK
ncbi:MAG: HD domain-containing protein [Candidatus Latescibacterota bacterium]|jgi:putative nucleotidyltransferase with HDIG domain|nr:MAG: HD domain-containing protein [Candidatus Latescibacterota bacterium]